MPGPAKKHISLKGQETLMRLWTKRQALAAAVLAMPLAFGTFSAPAPATAETVLRVIPHADLKNLDPIWTTAYISRNHGYLIYDTLFAMDAVSYTHLTLPTKRIV